MFALRCSGKLLHHRFTAWFDVPSTPTIPSFSFVVDVDGCCVTIVLYELSAEYIIVKLSTYSIRDDNRKIPTDCGKCHVKHDVTVLLT